jgi:translocation and assembly module TamB
MAWTLAGLGLLWALLCVLVLVASHSEYVRDWALAKARTSLAEAGYELDLESCRGVLAGKLEVKGLSLKGPGGKEMISAGDLSVELSLIRLLGGRVYIKEISLNKPVVHFPFPESKEGDSKGGGFALGLSIRRFDLLDGSFLPANGLGPLLEARNINTSGSFRLDARGPLLKAETLVLKARMDQGLGWISGRIRGLWEDEKVVLSEFDFQKGKNRIQGKGSLGWQRGFVWQAKAKAEINEVKDLPFAWPGSFPPESSLLVDCNLLGDAEKLNAAGGIIRSDQELGFKGEFWFEDFKGSLTAQLKGLELKSWGLSPFEAFLTGALTLDFAGPPLETSSSASLSAELSRFALPGYLEAALELKSSLFHRDLDLTRLMLKGDWGSLLVKGNAGLPVPGKDAHLREVRLGVDFKELTAPVEMAAHVPDWLGEARLNGKARFSGDWERLSWDIKLGPSHFREGIKVGQLIVGGLLAKGDWQVNSASVEGDWGRVKAIGRLDQKGAEMDFDLAIPSTRALEPFFRAYKIDPPQVQALDLKLKGRISGPWSGPDLVCQAAADHVEALDRFARRISLRFDARKLGPTPTGTLKITLLDTIEGDLFWNSIDLAAELSSQGGIANLRGVCELGEISFEISSKTPLKHQLPYTLGRMVVKPKNLEPWRQNGEAKIKWQPSGLSLKGFRLSQAEQTLTLSGFLLPDKSLDAKLEIINFQPAPWIPQRHLPASARLWTKVALAGSLAQPVIELTGRLDHLKWDDMDPARLEFNGGYDQKGFRLKGRVFVGQKKAFSWRATWDAIFQLAPVNLEPDDAALDLRASAEKFPLIVLDPLVDEYVSLGGYVNLDFKAKGPWRAPKAEGFLNFDNSSVMIGATGQNFENISGSILFYNKKLKIKELKVKSKGELVVNGFWNLPLQNKEKGFDLSLKARDFKASLGSVGEVFLNLDLALDGDMKRPRVTGEVMPLNANIRLGMAPPPDLKEVVLLAPHQKPPPIQTKETSLVWNPKGDLGGLSVDVLVKPPDKPEITLGNLGWVRLLGGVRLLKEPNKPLRYFNKVRATRGAVIVQGKRFVVNRAQLDFAGKNEPNPNLEGQAKITVGQTLIFINFMGTMLDPQYQLSSQPAMSETDILSTIIFGRPANSLNSGESRELTAQALALLGSQGAKEIKDLVGDQFAPDVVTVHDEAQSGSSLEAGKYLSSDLYLRYRHNLSQEGGDNVGIEYRINHWLSLESQVGTTRDTGVDVILNWDF